jgi:hypothetical protein
LLDDWVETLNDASVQFGELGDRWSDLEITELGRRLSVLASHGLDEEPELAMSVAVDIASLLDQVTVPGVAGPGADDWRF